MDRIVNGKSKKTILIWSIVAFIALIDPAFASAVAGEVASHTWEFSLSGWIFMLLVMFLVIILVATERVNRTLVVFFIAASLLFLNYSFGHFIPALQFLSLD